ncbi:MotA/TolQ/ExbB proton channel family protein [Siccirubricoccus sp. KC 17139]|uniref:MotA/TolQ/ExbB proton channel family protein n=1 Tax=Siccirubricoccus soli TaxID=2899147 RepID=A0ABT1CYA1_9PROT|nr:MotA/TolQ/ExbB proton channel family protein [Siccirubricoccus soli]MCO6414631.1 MotA/TolQ/ExbB proton channel family protein [Siccirubricoccus soli]MCP2680761.1 MotA/TolQ/ExbB proton channel family protein [Siccirubricoccus soli]
MQPSLTVQLLLAVVTAGLSLLLYGAALQQLRGQLADAYRATPILRVILEDSAGKALLPVAWVGAGRLHDTPAGAPQQEPDASGTTAPAPSTGRPEFADARPPTRADLFEVLRVLGIVEPDRELSEFTGERVGEADRPVQELIAHMEAVVRDGGRDLRDIGQLWFVTRLAARLGNAHGGCGGAPSSVCWEAALAQALAGYPGRSEAFLRQARDRPRRIGGGCQCAWTENGALSGVPGLTSYAFSFGSDALGDTAAARALLLLAGAIPLEAGAPAPAGSGQASAASVPEGAAAPQPAAEEQRAATQVAEVFIRRLLSRARTAPDVETERFWIDMLQGWPQLLLVWTTLLLTSLIAARTFMRWRLRREVRWLTEWLAKQRRLAPPHGQQGRAVVQDIVATLDRWLASGRRSAGERLWSSPGRNGSPAGSAAQLLRDRYPRVATRLERLLWCHHAGHIRKDSLALLMASKAVKRLLVGEPQPELFREFCEARRAIVDETAWLPRYLARALPALGFIGTVLGILYGLSGADSIVRAAGQEERAAAMSVVTGPLGLAFSTTFFALAAGLVTGFLIDRETARERLLLLEFEEALIEAIDPAEHAPASVRGAVTPQAVGD